ncbi:MAG: leucine-rich repeat domain-containing protein, partial [Candidatus Methanomethylophilaceae archaeon]|nr:leucine-rich repeat domain-containing protein [Candidatus Methanomethylophilaceae archaeon]
QSPVSVGAEFESGGLAYRVASMAPMAVEVSGYVGEPESVEVPPRVEHCGLSFAVAKVGESAFQGCSSLRELVVGEGVSSIGYCAFQGCASLESVTLPSTLSDVGKNAFGGRSFWSGGEKVDQDAEHLAGRHFEATNAKYPTRLIEVSP